MRTEIVLELCALALLQICTSTCDRGALSARDPTLYPRFLVGDACVATCRAREFRGKESSMAMATRMGENAAEMSRRVIGRRARCSARR